MPLDTILWVFAGVDVVCLAALGLLALRLRRQALDTAQTLSPAVKHASEAAKYAQRLSTQSVAAVRSCITEAQQLVALVRRRVETTRRIAGELRPAAGVPAKAVARDVGRTVTRGKEWAGRIRRLHNAGSQASKRTPRGSDGTAR